MTHFLMAGALFILAAARIPALRRNRKDPVFLAGVFAGVSSLLMAPSVYTPVDSALGGINVAKLALNSFMIVGLWFLRTAVLHAVTPIADARPSWRRTLPLTSTLGLQALFFVLTGPTTSTTQWGYDYHDRLAGALFSIMVILFIAWSCAEIAWTCFRYVPRMRRSFKVGFAMVGTGSVISCAVMLKMIQEVLSNFLTPLQAFGVKSPFAQVEMLAVVLVGVGLTIPALAGRVERRQAALRLDRTIAKVEAIRNKALASADMNRFLQADTEAPPHERLHRMIVEIWDAELATDGNSALADEDRDYVLLVESDFGLKRTS